MRPRHTLIQKYLQLLAFYRFRTTLSPPRIYVYRRLPRIHRARRQHAAAARQEPGRDPGAEAPR